MDCGHKNWFEHWMDCAHKNFLPMCIITPLSSHKLCWLGTQCLMDYVYPYQELQVQTLTLSASSNLDGEKKISTQQETLQVTPNPSESRCYSIPQLDLALPGRGLCKGRRAECSNSWMISLPNPFTTKYCSTSSPSSL